MFDTKRFLQQMLVVGILSFVVWFLQTTGLVVLQPQFVTLAKWSIPPLVGFLGGLNIKYDGPDHSWHITRIVFGGWLILGVVAIPFVTGLAQWSGGHPTLLYGAESAIAFLLLGWEFSGSEAYDKYPPD